MKVFIAISYADRVKQATILDTIEDVCKTLGYEFLTYVRKPTQAVNEKAMMDEALGEIASSDMLIAEVSNKAIGVGIEVGYAKALGKKIIYLRHESAERSTTIGGVSDIEITYCDTKDLRAKLSEICR